MTTIGRKARRRRLKKYGNLNSPKKQRSIQRKKRKNRHWQADTSGLFYL